MADNAKLGKPKKQSAADPEENPKRPPRPLKPKKERPGLIIQIDDRDYQKIQDETDGLFKFWYCMNRLAFKKGNPFSVPLAVLRRETGSADKQNTARIKILEAMGMISVKRGKTTRTSNEYTILAGVYKAHTREQTDPA
jgi:hypothetical protein